MEMSSCSDTVSMYFDMDGDGYGGSDSIVTLHVPFLQDIPGYTG